MFRSVWVRIGIIAVILVAGFVLKDFVSGNAGELSVGDCFDTPTDAIETVTDVQHHPCTDLHDAEVFFVGDYGPVSSAEPTQDEYGTFYESSCTPAFNAYTGLDFATDTTDDMGAFRPTSDGWTGGDHKVICYAVRADSAKMSTSIKKS